MPSDRANMIVARMLSKRFGRHIAVDSINLAIPRGGVVGFLGPNGAGKTTTIRMIAGYLPPTAGTVEVDGLDVVRHGRAVRQRIGYLPESAPLYTEMRVVEFLRFRAKLFGIPWSARRRAIDLALNRCGLGDVRRRPIHQLSKGYRQRVGLAAALLHEPPALILDEPTVGLDPAQIRDVRLLIRELGRHHTILLSSHILPEIEMTCDRIVMIARGRIRADGTIDELRRAAAQVSRYTLETDVPVVAGALRALAGVNRVDSTPADDCWNRIIVTASQNVGDLREPIANAVAKAQGRTRELTREAPSLEHLFINMIAEAWAGDESMPPADPASPTDKIREAAA